MKLSIIIPVYNASRHLPACLDSCLNQSPFCCGHDYEIVCVNDGSTDASLSILQDYSGRNHGIKVISQENSGVSRARNNGLSHAKGQYIWYVDSDDLIRQNCLAPMLEAIIAHNATACTFQYQNCADDYQLPSSIEKIEYTFVKDRWPVVGGNCPVTIIIEKDYLLHNGICFDEEMSFGEDTLWRYFIGLYLSDYIDTEEAVYYYRQVPTSAMHNTSSKRNERWLDSMKHMCLVYQDMLANHVDRLNKSARLNTKERLYWSVANVLFGALRVRKGEETIREFKERGLYPYPILWGRLFESRNWGGLKTNLFCLLFPLEWYYRLVCKVFVLLKR